MAYTTINKSTDHFSTLLYSGNSSARSLTGVGFAPSFVWIKERTSTSDHMLFDQPRGVQKYISSNLNNAEQTSAAMLTAFDSDGFSLGSGNDVNDNGQTYVSWNWKANGQGSSNTDGSINTTYTSVNTTAGFSISKWTGSGSTGSIGHGLGVKPNLVIIKNLGTATHWLTWFDSFSNTEMIYLDLTNAKGTSQTYFNSQTPTSSLIYLNNGVSENQNTMVAYCFAEKTGFSKFGSYTGNGNADGAFIYTGFKPALFVVKRYDSSGEYWNVLDNKRNPENPADDFLYWSENSAEGVKSSKIDFVSNGIKIRGTDGAFNNSSGSYIYMAFAEAPLVGTNNVPATAR